MGRLRRHDVGNGTAYSASCWMGGTISSIAYILLALGCLPLTLTAPLIWNALRELFGPAHGDFSGWLGWVFTQGITVAAVPIALVGLLLITIALLILGMGLFVTTLRRDGDVLHCTLGLRRWQFAERRIPLAAIAGLGLLLADRSTGGRRERVTLDLIAHLRLGVTPPAIIGVDLVGALFALLARQDPRQPIYVTLLCKLTDGDEAVRLGEELGQAWQLPWDPQPGRRPPLHAEGGGAAAVDQRLER